MLDLINYIAFDLWTELGDPETDNYFWLRGGPWLTLLASAGYLWLVLKIGPEFMKDRKPYNLKWAIRLYNLILVAINTYLFWGSVVNFRFGLDFWGCNQSLNPEKKNIFLYYGHLFFHTRYLEFFDTFFFILRKKYNQVSFLHVFHHAIVPSLMYIGLKFYPVPYNGLLPTTNMFVHIIMYAYYGLATFGPGMQKYLWWKRYLTTLQISQFVLLLIHCSQPFYYLGRPDCNMPTGMLVVNSITALTFLFLFVSFYRQTYGGSKAKSQPQAIKNAKLPASEQSTNGMRVKQVQINTGSNKYVTDLGTINNEPDAKIKQS